MERKDLLIDMDDTLNRMQRGVIIFINSNSSTKIRFKDWDSNTREGGNKQVEELIQEFLQRPDLVIKTHPFKKALVGVRALHEQGFNLHIVSARKEPLHQTTEEWLEKHGFFPFITAIHHRPSYLRGPDFKVEVAKKIDARAAFDDTKDVAEAFAASNIPIYLIRKPWNRELPPSKLIIPQRSFYQAVQTFLLEEKLSLLENYGSHQT